MDLERESLEERLFLGDLSAVWKLIIILEAQGLDFEDTLDHFRQLLRKKPDLETNASDLVFVYYFNISLTELQDKLNQAFHHLFPKCNTQIAVCNDLYMTTILSIDGSIYLVPYVEHGRALYEIQLEISIPASYSHPGDIDYKTLMTAIPTTQEAIKQMLLFYVRYDFKQWAEGYYENLAYQQEDDD